MDDQGVLGFQMLGLTWRLGCPLPDTQTENAPRMRGVFDPDC
jgi:hypothetical protein